MPIPENPKIYHIVHYDKLPSIIADGKLWCDAEVIRRSLPGTTIGMSKIKRRRLEELSLASHPELMVGDCVPFYFCPRSVMLYLIYRGNDEELTFQGGQGPIIHIEADLYDSIAWADSVGTRWAFTLSNAGARFFEDRCNLKELNEINWEAIQTNRWSGDGIPGSVKEGKQAEFLIEGAFPWDLVTRIGVYSRPIADRVNTILQRATHKPPVKIIREWYY